MTRQCTTAKPFSVPVSVDKPEAPTVGILDEPVNAAGINLEWVRYLTPMLTTLLSESQWGGTEEAQYEASQEIEQLRVWLYSEKVSEVKITLEQISLGATQTIGTGGADVTNSAFTHNFTKPKALIEALIEVVAPNGGGNQGRISVKCDGTGGGTGSFQWCANAIRATLSPSLLLTNVAPGNHEIKLYGETTLNSMVVQGTTYQLQYKITEFD